MITMTYMERFSELSEECQMAMEMGMEQFDESDLGTEADPYHGPGGMWDQADADGNGQLNRWEWLTFH